MDLFVTRTFGPASPLRRDSEGDGMWTSVAELSIPLVCVFSDTDSVSDVRAGVTVGPPVKADPEGAETVMLRSGDLVSRRGPHRRVYYIGVGP